MNKYYNIFTLFAVQDAAHINHTHYHEIYAIFWSISAAFVAKMDIPLKRLNFETRFKNK